MEEITKKIIKWLIWLIISLVNLKVANDIGSYWVLVLFPTTFWLGMQTYNLLIYLKMYSIRKSLDDSLNETLNQAINIAKKNNPNKIIDLSKEEIEKKK